MAIDEWLMSQVGEIPILRFYHWEGDWVSLGYFQSLEAAREIFGPKPQYVRRWTGGGVVDHRNDATYTLIVPKSNPLASIRGARSYGEIHRALAACLKSGGLPCEFVSEEQEIDSVACFEKPVTWDLLSGGKKIAGAGQRRTRQGMLHQGSVTVEMPALEEFPSFLSEKSQSWSPGKIQQINPRFQTKEWLERVL